MIFEFLQLLPFLQLFDFLVMTADRGYYNAKRIFNNEHPNILPSDLYQDNSRILVIAFGIL